jgi:drug/metabolite transporter (DMT)-like permease
VVTLSDRLGRPPTVAALLWTLFGLGGLTAGTIVQGRLRSSAGPAALAATEVAAATIVMAVWAPLEGSLAVPATPHAVSALLWIALVPGVGGPLLFFALIRQRGATVASSLLLVVPAVTAIAGWPILGKPVGVTALLGLAVSATGLRLATKPTRRPLPAGRVVIPAPVAVLDGDVGHLPTRLAPTIKRPRPAGVAEAPLPGGLRPGSGWQQAG